MKKLLIIITLFISSFFLYCNVIYAATYNLTAEMDFGIFTEEFFTNRNKLLTFLETDEKYSNNYIISLSSSGTYTYFILPLDSDLSLATCHILPPQLRCGYSSKLHIFNINYSEVSGSSNTFLNIITSKNFIVDSNIDFLFTGSYAGSTITFNYNDYSKLLVSASGLKLPTVYDMYIEYNSVEEENPHQEEIDKVSNFYTMVIEKISYLAEQISCNYILLSIIGIFIITFVFLLIFRRFL